MPIKHLLKLLFRFLACSTLVIAATSAFSQGTYIYQSGSASAGGCASVVDAPPDLFLQDAGATMLERHVQEARAETAGGDLAGYKGAVKLGKISPFNATAKAFASITEGCQHSDAHTNTDFRFVDLIQVSAGAHPVGTPVTYTATIEVPVALKGRGAVCGTNGAEFVASLRLNEKSYEWRTNGFFDGVASLTVSATVNVGQSLRISLDTRARAVAHRYLGAPERDCALSKVAMTKAARIVLTADTLDANTTSINGVKYGL